MIPPVGANVAVVYRPTQASAEVHLGRVMLHLELGFWAEAENGQIMVRCDLVEEGVEWCRDWSGAKVKALKILVALG